MCVHRVYLSTYLEKIKKKGEFVFNNEQLGKGIEKRSKRPQSDNRRLIEDRPKIVDLKQRFGETWRSIP
jgi:hypothetical protein